MFLQKSGARWTKTPKGDNAGWIDKNGDVWVPDDHKGTHAPHWDVQWKNGKDYHTVYPTVQTEPVAAGTDPPPARKSWIEKIGDIFKSAAVDVPNNGAPVGEMAPATQSIYTQGTSRLGAIVLTVITGGLGAAAPTTGPLVLLP